MNKKLRDMLHRYVDKYMGAGTATEKKLLVSKEETVDESIPADSQLITTEDGGLINRTILRISHQEIENQKNFESVIGMADEDLASRDEEANNDGKEMDEDWFNQFSRYAMGVSNEDMKKGWAKVLSREIRKPGSFSIRTLNLMSTLRRNEGMTQEERWITRYEEVRTFIETNKRNPSKHRIEEHDMLNWVKANRKALNTGKLKADRIEAF